MITTEDTLRTHFEDCKFFVSARIVKDKETQKVKKIYIKNEKIKIEIFFFANRVEVLVTLNSRIP